MNIYEYKHKQQRLETKKFDKKMAHHRAYQRLPTNNLTFIYQKDVKGISNIFFFTEETINPVFKKKCRRNSR